MIRQHRKVLTAITLAFGLAVAASGCSTGAPDATTLPAPTTGTEQPSGEVHLHDAWVKSAESGMSAAFGLIENHTDQDVVVISASSPASESIELHETALNADGQMVMRELEGGFVIPAHGQYLLEPGGNHLMLMSLTGPLLAGDVVEFTLTLDDGSTIVFEAPIKDYSGANEQYEHGDHGDHDHGDDEDNDH